MAPTTKNKYDFYLLFAFFLQARDIPLGIKGK